MGWFTSLSPVPDVIQLTAPASLSTVNANAGTTLLIIDGSGTIAVLTVNLPSNPSDGQRFVIASTVIITTLSLSTGTIKGFVTTMSLNGYARYAYSSSLGAWVRTG